MVTRLRKSVREASGGRNGTRRRGATSDVFVCKRRLTDRADSIVGAPTNTAKYAFTKGYFPQVVREICFQQDTFRPS